MTINQTDQDFIYRVKSLLESEGTKLKTIKATDGTSGLYFLGPRQEFLNALLPVLYTVWTFNRHATGHTTTPQERG
jgi:hypothetical protein